MVSYSLTLNHLLFEETHSAHILVTLYSDILVFSYLCKRRRDKESLFSRRFSFLAKVPDYYSGSFFLFFSSGHRPHPVCTTFCTDFNRLTYNPAVTGSSPCFSHKRFRAFSKADETEGSPLSIFFRHCATFFSKLFCLQRSPFKFFDVLLQTGFSKSPMGPPFYNFKNFALFEP